MAIVQLLSKKAKYISNIEITPVTTFMVIFAGESNAGGAALNTDATTYEKTIRQSVQKLSEYTNVFEYLQIGVNNLQDHADIADNNSHGWELGLANEIEVGTFLGKTQLHLVKTGQGGSRIANWNVGGTYFNKLTSRFNYAKNILIAANKSYKPIIWYTQGINDANSGTNASTWKAATIAHFTQLRNLIGANTPILITQMPIGSTGENYNTQVNEIVAEVPNCYLISSVGATKRDQSHWDYAGYKLLANRLSLKTELLLNV